MKKDKIKKRITNRNMRKESTKTEKEENVIKRIVSKSSSPRVI